jgi:hypothetical protein
VFRDHYDEDPNEVFHRRRRAGGRDEDDSRELAAV